MSAANSLMLECLLGLLPDEAPLSPGLRRLIDAGIEQAHGCYFLANLLKGCRHMTSGDFPDATGFECFVNKMYVNDFTDDLDQTALRQQGLAYAQALRAKLATLDTPFVVIVNFGEKDCIVRFHAVRDGETWLTEDLEAYEMDALLSLSVGGSRPH